MSGSSGGTLFRESQIRSSDRQRHTNALGSNSFRKSVNSATNTRVDSCGRTLYGHNGGIWEWTSTDFEGLPGFETSEVYPGYSTDFFDGLHKVVVSPPTPLLYFYITFP